MPLVCLQWSGRPGINRRFPGKWPRGVPRSLDEQNMPKIKTKSSAKKRFTLTATGKVRMNHAGKRHGMIKRTKKFLRNARHSSTMAAPDAQIVKRNFLRNG